MSERVRRLAGVLAVMAGACQAALFRDQPTGVTAIAGDAEATVSWSAPADAASERIVAYFVTSTPGGVTASTTQTSVVVAGLTNGITYTFMVRASTARGDGLDSPASNAVTPMTTPGPPLEVTAGAANESATVTWTPPEDNGGSGITGYVVTTQPGGAQLSTPATLATVQALQDGTAYTFTVHAINAAGDGAESTPSNPVTPVGRPNPGTSSFAATPDRLHAGGAAATLTLAVRDEQGNPLAGQEVVVHATGIETELTPVSGETDAQGNFVATLTSTLAGAQVVTAQVDAFALTTSVVFTTPACGDPATLGAAATDGGPSGSVFTSPSCIVAADFNGDGEVDLAEGMADGGFGVLLGNGDGTFSEVVGYMPFDVAAMTTGDFNGDEAVDLAVAVSSEASLDVLNGSGNGYFGESCSYSVGAAPVAVVAADLNGDGVLDLVSANIQPGSVTVVLRAGVGDCQAPTSQISATVLGGRFQRPTALMAADFNGDGTVDLAVADQGNNTVVLMFGAGDGTFPTVVVYRVGPGPMSVATGDFNADGVLDLAVTNNAGDAVSLLLGQAGGVFQAATDVTVGPGPTAVVVGDFNSDGRLDLAVLSSDLSVVLGNGDGTFRAPVSYGLRTNPSAVVAADFNDDGRLDLAAADTSAVTVLLEECLNLRRL